VRCVSHRNRISLTIRRVPESIEDDQHHRCVPDMTQIRFLLQKKKLQITVGGLDGTRVQGSGFMVPSSGSWFRIKTFLCTPVCRSRTRPSNGYSLTLNSEPMNSEPSVR